MTLYEIICDMAKHHCRIRDMGSTDQLKFDLENKSIRCGNGYIVQNGRYCVDWLDLSDGTFYLLNDSFFNMNIKDPYVFVEELFKEYIVSRPSSIGAKNKGNFRAKTSDELSFDQLINGQDRLELQYRLEAFILLGALKGIFKWENNKHWFWKSKNVPGLILYKNWLINKEEK